MKLRLHPIVYLIVICLAFWGLVIRSACSCSKPIPAAPISEISIPQEYSAPERKIVAVKAIPVRRPFGLQKIDTLAPTNRIGFVTYYEAVVVQDKYLDCWYNGGEYHREVVDTVVSEILDCIGGRLSTNKYLTRSGVYTITKFGDRFSMSTPTFSSEQAMCFAYKVGTQIPDTSSLDVPRISGDPVFILKG